MFAKTKSYLIAYRFQFTQWIFLLRFTKLKYMIYHAQGTRNSSQRIDNFSDVVFLEGNTTDSDEAVQYWSEL